jgi:uroporphyrinogen decarboxylase
MEYKGYDRPPTTFYGTPEITQNLLDHFGTSDYEVLCRRLGVDLRYVGPRYIGPELKSYPDGSWEGLWGENYHTVSFGHGTYPEPKDFPYKNVETLEELAKFPKPSADWYDYSEIKEQCKRLEGFVIYSGDAGNPDYINGIGRCRTMERVLIDLAEENEVLLKMMEERFKFFYDLEQRILEAADGLIDVYCSGEDLGTQNGLVISPRTYNRFFAPSMQSLFSLAHNYGARTMMHSCGSCRNLIERLIELGLDILEVVQVDTANMDMTDLHKHFYKRIAFCGSISVQNTLPFGTREDVIREVNLRKELFKDGGMIIAPTHAIQSGTPLENVLAMYETIGSMQS